MNKQLFLILLFCAFFKIQSNSKLLTTAAISIPTATIAYNFWQDKQLVENDKSRKSHRGIESLIGLFGGMIPFLNLVCIGGWGINKLDDYVNKEDENKKDFIATKQGFIAGVTSYAIILYKINKYF